MPGVGSRVVQGFAADLYDLAVEKDDLAPQDVVARDPVLQAVRAAGIFSDIASRVEAFSLAGSGW